LSDRRWPRITDWVLDNCRELFRDLDKDQIEAHLLLFLERGKEAEQQDQTVEPRTTLSMGAQL
jgi:hypothetical protein